MKSIETCFLLAIKKKYFNLNYYSCIISFGLKSWKTNFKNNFKDKITVTSNSIYWKWKWFGLFTTKIHFFFF